MVVDLTDWPRFFVKAVMGLAPRPRFRFIEMFVLGVSLGGANGLAIGRAILTRANVAVGFYGLSL